MSEETIIIAATSLIGLCVVVAALLRAWAGWLALKRRELEHPCDNPTERGSPAGAARIEIADLKERIRKLEAIANGVDL